MDKKQRQLERKFASNGSLEVAELLVRHKMKTGELENLMKIPAKTFKHKNWVELGSNKEGIGCYGLQLPHGIFVKYVGYSGRGGLAFIPGIRIVK